MKKKKEKKKKHDHHILTRINVIMFAKQTSTLIIIIFRKQEFKKTHYQTKSNDVCRSHIPATVVTYRCHMAHRKVLL